MAACLKKLILTLFCLALLPSVTYCQLVPPWAADIGGPNATCTATAMMVDAGNFIYVAGTFTGTVNFNPFFGGNQPKKFTAKSRGGVDIFVAKFYANGGLVWLSQYDYSNAAQPTGITASPNGLVTVTGQFDGTFDADPGPGITQLKATGPSDAFLLQLNGDGTYLRALKIQGDAVETGNKVAADKANNVIEVGQFTSKLQVGNLNFTAKGTTDGLVIKYDAAGNVIWGFDLGAAGGGNNAVTDVVVDNNNNIIVTGNLNGNVNFNPLGSAVNASGTNSIYIAQYSPQGMLQWVKPIIGTAANFDYSPKLGVDDQDNVYISGLYNAPINLDHFSRLNPKGKLDIFFAKYSSAGAIKWARTIGSPNSSLSVTIKNGGIAVSPDNRVFLTGYYNGLLDFDPSTTQTANWSGSSAGDLFLAWYDTNGNYQKVFATGNGCNNNIPNAVAVNRKNQVVLTGSFCSTVDFDMTGCKPIILTAQSATRDMFLAAYTTDPAPPTPITNNIITLPADSVNCTAVPPGILTGSVPAGASDLTFQWQSSVNGVQFDDITSATAQDYQPTLRITYYYRRVVRSKNDCTTTSYSNIVQLYYENYPFSNNVTKAPNITSFCNTADPGYINGSIAYDDGEGKRAYQWQSSTDNVTFADIPNADQQDYRPIVNRTTYFRRAVTSLCSPPAYSNVITITVASSITNNTLTAPATSKFCLSGDPGVITGSAATAPPGVTFSYQWQVSTDSAVYKDIPLATAQNYDPPLVNVTTYYRRLVTSSDCAVPVTGDVITIEIDPLVTDNTITAPLASRMCSAFDPDKITGSVPAGGNGTYGYQWQSSADSLTFTNINGATSRDYDPPLVNSTTYYRRIVVSGACVTPLISNVIKIDTKAAGPSNNVLTQPTMNCYYGDPDVITGTDAIGTSVTYQWERSSDGKTYTAVPNATGRDYDPPEVILTTVYYRRMVSAGGGCTTPSASNVIKITFYPLLTDPSVPPAVTTFCGPGDPGLIKGGTPTGGDGVNYTYTWSSSTNNAFTNIPGATGPDYDPPTVTATTYFFRTVYSGGCSYAAPGVRITIVNDVPLVNTINQQTPDPTLCSASADPSLITGSEPPAGSGEYTYQWQSSTDKVNFTDISGATDRDYDAPVITMTTHYRRLATSKVVCATPPPPSNIYTISVDGIADNVIGQIVPDEPFCSLPANPKPITGLKQVTGGTGTYAYVWQSSTDGQTYTDIPNSNLPNYDPEDIATTTYYRRMIKGEGVCVGDSYSNAVVIVVATNAPNNQITAPAVVKFCDAGDPEAITGNLLGGYNLQWQTSADSVTFADIPGATSANYDPPPLTGRVYFRRMVSLTGCGVPTPSNIIGIHLGVTPTAPTVSPTQTICAGSNITLTATGGTTYKWLPATGLSADNVASPVASPTDTTTYTVIISNGFCGTTRSVTVNVTPGPVVDAGPDKDVFTGEQVQLNGKVTGNNVHYSWSPATYLSDPNVLDPTVSPKETITYTLTASTDQGCFDVTDKVTINVYDKMLIPSAFTPNGDGVNDTWAIAGLNHYPNSVLNVFNRNGQSIFRATGNSKAWDGRYNGKLLPFGTYYYTIDLKDGTKVISGWLAIVK